MAIEKKLNLERFIQSEGRAQGPLKIDSHIPPPAPGRSKANWRSPLYETMLALEVGQSFFVECLPEKRERLAARIASKKRRIELRGEGKAFTTRQEKDPSGVRVWRTA